MRPRTIYCAADLFFKVFVAKTFLLVVCALQALNESKEELEKTLEMLNVRFQSVSKILEMQEQAITAHTTAISDPQL